MGVQPITIPQSLAYVLNNAGDKSNVDFNYLVETAQRESSMNPSATTPSSSAVGLFQFLDTTWLQVMKEEGPRLGYQKYADAITQDKDGNYTIADKTLRAQVLKLRQDPQVAADMAAAFTQSNGAYLKSKFGRMPSPGELYIAHFLGPQGAEKMFDAGLQNPDQVAAKLFPQAAKANPQIFYQDGHARTIREVYKALVAKHDGIVAEPVPDAPDPKFTAQQMASSPGGGQQSATTPDGASADTDVVPSRFSKADMSFTSMFATDAPTGVPTPLIGTEAAAPLLAAKGGQSPLALLGTTQPEPLAAIDSAMSGSGPDDASVTDDHAAALGFSPLPAPTPLLPPDPTGATTAAATLPAIGLQPLDLMAGPAADTGIPRPRVLMTPRADGASSAFLTQLYASP